MLLVKDDFGLFEYFLNTEYGESDALQSRAFERLVLGGNCDRSLRSRRVKGSWLFILIDHRELAIGDCPIG